MFAPLFVAISAGSDTYEIELIISNDKQVINWLIVINLNKSIISSSFSNVLSFYKLRRAHFFNTIEHFNSLSQIETYHLTKSDWEANCNWRVWCKLKNSNNRDNSTMRTLWSSIMPFGCNICNKTIFELYSTMPEFPARNVQSLNVITRSNIWFWWNVTYEKRFDERKSSKIKHRIELIAN